MKKFVFIFVLLVNSILLNGQPVMNLDSLLALLPNVREDTVAVDLYISIGQQYENNNPLLARQYYRKAGQLSVELNYPVGFCKYAANYTSILNMQGAYDSALAINLEALDKAKQSGDKMWEAKMMFNIGNGYNHKYEFETALTYYLQVTAYFEEIDHKPYLGMIYDVMQTLYQNLDQYRKAIFYGEKAILYLSDDTTSNFYGNSLLNLSISYLYATPSQPKKALEGFNKTLTIAIQNENRHLEATSLQNIADVYYRTLEVDKVKPYYDKALALFTLLEDFEGVCTATRGLAYYEVYKANYGLSEQLTREALALAKKNNLEKEVQKCYALLADLALARNDYTAYRGFLTRQDSVSMEILNGELLRAIQDKESKYEAEKKQAQIQILQQQKEIRNIYIYGLAAVTLLLAATGILYSGFQKRKRLVMEKDAHIKATRINELEKEKQLTAAQSLLEGEEAERKRLARDLHDGLGGMLSVVKLKLMNMKGNVILPEADVSVFHHAVELLDSSIRELRRVAHNLMPESLTRYGLKAALTDFCGGIDQIHLHYFGDDARFEEKYEIATFRIIQELVNNSLKHSKADMINVQVIMESERINIVVQDNGIGFDPNALDETKTTGLSSIRSRVESLNGHMELISKNGGGSEAHIEFTFKK